MKVVDCRVRNVILAIDFFSFKSFWKAMKSMALSLWTVMAVFAVLWLGITGNQISMPRFGSFLQKTCLLSLG